MANCSCMHYSISHPPPGQGAWWSWERATAAACGRNAEESRGDIITASQAPTCRHVQVLPIVHVIQLAALPTHKHHISRTAIGLQDILCLFLHYCAGSICCWGICRRSGGCCCCNPAVLACSAVAVAGWAGNKQRCWAPVLGLLQLCAGAGAVC